MRFGLGPTLARRLSPDYVVLEGTARSHTSSGAGIADTLHGMAKLSKPPAVLAGNLPATLPRAACPRVPTGTRSRIPPLMASGGTVASAPSTESAPSADPPVPGPGRGHMPSAWRSPTPRVAFQPPFIYYCWSRRT